MALTTLHPERPPCSEAERRCAEVVANELARLGVRPRVSSERAPTSPTWVPMVRAVARAWAAAFVAADMPIVAAVLAVIAVAGGIRWARRAIASLPMVGGTTQNVVALVDGTDPSARPIVVTAHLDSHPTDGSPLAAWHRVLAAVSGWIIFAAASSGRPSWRTVAGPVAIEAVVTLGWLARGELRRHLAPPDDNTSGLMAIVRLAELARRAPPNRDLWIVAAGAATSGESAISAFFRDHPQLSDAWVVEVDALGSGEVVASPVPSRFPAPGTPAALVRAIAAAARATGDPIELRRVRRPHSDARVALRRRVAAVTLTAGLRHPARHGPDVANAARAARIAYELANLPG